MRLEDFDTGNTYTATVLSSIRITSDTSPEEVREIVLEVDRENFSYEPGQSIGVVVPPSSGEIGHKRYFRMYSVADTSLPKQDRKPQVTICVKRCNYIDDYSGEEYKGIASHHLCNLGVGDAVKIKGPYGIPFEVPEDRNSDLLLIGMGTGIAPFRAFVKHLYKDVRDWKGKVRLFYGAKTGLELLYMNDKKDDFTQYYDEETFESFKALSPRPHWADPVAMDDALEQRAGEILSMLAHSKTHVYVAGGEDILEMLDKTFARMEGSTEAWLRKKSELKAEKRWVELIY